MKLKRLAKCVVGFTLAFATWSATAEPKTVPYVDVSRYLGTWYQIARNTLPFEAGCVCSRQVLGIARPDVVSVYNSCNDKSVDGVIRDIRGTATNDDPATNARFTVDFGLPVKGQYWIIGIGDNYEYAVVSDPSEASLYILSKTPTLPTALFDEAVLKAMRAGVRTDNLEMTLQNGCSYPR